MWTDIFVKDNGMTAAEQEANYARLQRLADERRAARGGNTNVNFSGVTSELLPAADGIWPEFGRGLQEGLQNAADGTRGALAGTVNTVFSAIPWQIWLLAGLGLFLYAGGGIWLQNRLNK